LSSIASELERGGVVALLHGNADPDALASAFAVQTCFPDVVIWTPGGTDRMAKEMTRSLGIEVVESADRPPGTLLVLDTSGPEQLPEGIDFSDAIVVDHHARTERWSSARMYYCDDSKSSCSEIVLELIEASGKKTTKEAALALMAGILTDTGMFKFGRPSALKAFADLMERNGVQMDEATALVHMDMDISERISQLRGAQRLKYWKVGEYIVASSQGSAFEASVCKALISLGADVAFVGSQRGDNFRVSARATQEMVRVGIHLGRLLGGVGSETSNGGGGHPGAAGITGTGDVEAILNISVENAVNELRRLVAASSGDR
jgi:phosphoesterase RecJ-like protein